MTYHADSWQWHMNTAVEYFGLYQERQRQIDLMAQQAIASADGDVRAAQLIHLDKRDTPLGFEYHKLCGDRDTYVNRAQLSAAMATMLFTVGLIGGQE